MKHIRSFGLLIFVGVMWWGLVYPELCFMEGTYEIAAVTAADVLSGQIVIEDSDELDNLEESENREELTDIEGLFAAGPEKIIVKSKVMRNLIQ